MPEDSKVIKINKWDQVTVRNSLDDAVKQILNNKSGWQEYFSLFDIKLLISFVAVCFSSFAAAWHYVVTFEEVKPVLLICSVGYFATVGVLQLFQWFVEKGCFYQAVQKCNGKTRTWRWSSEMKTYDDKYKLTASVKGGDICKSNFTEKSISNYISEDGIIVFSQLEKEIDYLLFKATN